MTKEELKKLYDAKQKAESEMYGLHAKRFESFEADLTYQLALIAFGRAVNAYDDAVRVWAQEQATKAA